MVRHHGHSNLTVFFRILVDLRSGAGELGPGPADGVGGVDGVDGVGEVGCMGRGFKNFRFLQTTAPESNSAR